MTEPTTLNLGLVVPNTGDLVGSWGTTALNANTLALDGRLGGVVTISLSGATTIALSAPSASITPGAGPTQQQNRLIRFTGTQTGNAVIEFSLPGDYVIDNQCTGPSGAAGTGTFVGVPPGAKTLIFFDGTNVDFLNPPLPGTPIDLHGATQVPSWMTACSKAYALVKDGTTYSTALDPQLSAMLGSTFGGNGVSTFGVPDERSRMRLALDNTGVNRVTTAVSGINGQQMGAAGGDQAIQAHSHANTPTDPTHTHTPAGSATIPQAAIGQYANAGGFTGQASGAGGTLSGTTTGITITNATSGLGAGANMPPTIVSFLALIKT